MTILANKLQSLPQKPGVYLFKDAKGGVLYVGKAKNLKKRVKSYFPPHPTFGHLLPQAPTSRREQGEKEEMKSLLGRGIKEEIMLSQISDLDYIIVSSELESLMLENNLIKQHRPRFNVRMRDDKNYQFIKIDYASEIPQVYAVRKITPSSSPPISSASGGRTGGERAGVYFGPYTSGLAVKQTLKLLKRIFHLCANKKVGSRPCFYYHLRRCGGVCIGQVSLLEYRQSFKEVEQFLNHRQSEIVKSLKAQMQTAAAKREFEKAASFRDKLLSLQRIWEKQKVVFPKNLNEDYFSLYIAANQGVVNLFQIRGGKLIHQEAFEVAQPPSEQSSEEIMNSFLKQYYAEASNLPKTILTKHLLPDRAAMEKWLKVKILGPRRGKKFQLLNLGEENAKDYYEKNYASPEKLLAQLQALFNLAHLPRRIEAYDISNIQGFLPVGSMVVFQDGEPAKSEYRKFKINPKQTPNDVAMMREMLERRFRHLTSHNPSPPSPYLKGRVPRATVERWPLPDLIVIDGGKGQLNAAVQVLEKYNLSPYGRSPAGGQLPVIGLAKRLEEIFIPGRKHSIILPQNSPVLFLLQRIRDEAHRFAIMFYRSRHRKALLE